MALSYDPDSPSGLMWKENRYNGKGKTKLFISKGEAAGTFTADGYWRVQMGDKVVSVHRVIWELFNGEIPEDMTIDHIDRDSSNNKIENLRLVAHAVNCRNRSQYSNNKTGFTGVSYFEPKERSPRYTASWFTLDGKLRSKSFSLSKYGDAALILAVEYRKKMIDQLNDIGAQYAENHGDIKP
jgi:hypothetical protein